MNALDIITEHYLRAGVWSSLLYEANGIEDPVPFDTQFEWDDCSNIDDVRAEITDFLIGNFDDVLELCYWCCTNGIPGEQLLEQFGHDFLLTRDGHGCGFWDRGYPEALGRRLSEAARIYGDSQFMPNDDGLTYTAQGSTR